MDPELSEALHLPSLKISGFRGFDSLTIPRLGRVTLLAGRNSVGKTSVLDAVRLFAARGRPSVLGGLLRQREELVTGLDEDKRPLAVPDVAALFHGRGEVRATAIAIGPGSEEEGLRLAASLPEEWTDGQIDLLPDSPLDLDVEAVTVKYGSWSEFVPWHFMGGRSPLLRGPHLRRGRPNHTDWPAPILCESLGPGLPESLASWGRIALTEDELFLAHALGLVVDEGVDRIAVVSGEGGPTGFRSTSHRVILRLRGSTHPVPLKSFGDGATRLFGTAMALTRSRKGLLVIDEAENGLHYTIHEDFWRMVLDAARAGDIQVLATTHSWDCIVGFARAATECEHADGVLVRLDRGEQGCRAVMYSEDELAVAAAQRIEVR